MNQEHCPCGSQQTYQDCCKPLLSGQSSARRPEQLMRSRYTAFCVSNAEYLEATHHPAQREPHERQALEASFEGTDWLGLKVLHVNETRMQEGIGSVEFAAFYKNQNGVGQLHEVSEFVLESGQWFYVQGQSLEPIKIGRNDPCWCSSGKKYKKCHG